MHFKYEARLHSSRMHTTHSLPVSPSMHCTVGVPASGLGGTYLWYGGCLLPGGTCLWSWGVSAPGKGACLWSGGCISACNGAEPPLWTEWQTGAKILPCPELPLRAVIIGIWQTSFAGGNNRNLVKISQKLWIKWSFELTLFELSVSDL